MGQTATTTTTAPAPAAQATAATAATTATAVAPAFLTARVHLAGADKVPVKGLFIAFKLTAANENDKASRLAEVLREDAIEKFHTKKQADYYARILAEYQAQRDETVADPASRYVLGITDADGYLEPVYDSSNPWRDRYARLEPDTFKFSVGEKYTALFIRHPSPDLARAVTRALNGEPAGRPDVDLTDAKLWGTPESFTIKAGSGVDGEQFAIQVPAAPQSFVPHRIDDPQKWWLYAGMPHETVESVRNQVRSLVTSLGILKYPATGDQDMPYSAAMIADTIESTQNNKYMNEAAKAKRVATLSDDLYSFHGPLQAAAARFQEHVAEGRAFQPQDWDKAQERLSWASEIGEDAEATKVAIPRLEQGGVIGPVTDAQLALWETNKWIKPDEHLVTIGFDPPPGSSMPVYHVFMLSRGAFAFNAWSQLGKTLGGCYGINSGHSYRQLMAEGGGGAIKNSIHKTGLAVDLTGARQRTTKATWPVRFEAEFRRIKQKVTLPQLEEVLRQKEQALKDANAAREADRTKASTALNEAIDVEKLLKAPPVDPKKAPTKKQLNTAAEKVKTARTNLAGIDAKHQPAIDRATTARDNAKANVEAMKEAIRRDSDRFPKRWRMRFRLFGHSYADVFAPDAATRKQARDALKPAIAAWAGIPWPKADDNPPENGGVDGKFCDFLRTTYLGGLPRNATDPWLRKQFSFAYAFAKELLTLEPDAIVDRYFRESITQWRVNFYERDGGSDMTESWKADQGNADFPIWPGAKSWINLTAIGHGCHMHRISPHNMDSRDKLSFADNPEKIPPMAYPMSKYLEFEKSKAEQGDIVAAIEDITATAAQAPELAHKDFRIQFVVPTGKHKETELAEEVGAAEIDGMFLKDWRRRLANIQDMKNAPAYTAGGKGVYKPQGACLSVVLNELNPDRQGALKQVLAFFSGEFKTRRFQIVESGQLVDDEVIKGKIFTGAELAAAANAALTRLTAEAAAQKAAAEAAAKEAKAQEEKEAAAALAATKKGKGKGQGKPKKSPPKKKADVPEPPKFKVEDWSFLLQPLFTAQPQSNKMLFLPEHIVLLPARENAAHLEWWHYQHNSVKEAGTWAKLLNECGYSTAVMKVPADGALAPSGEPVHFGLGYREDSELGSHPWPPDSEIAEPPANRDTGAEEAVEDDPENFIE